MNDSILWQENVSRTVEIEADSVTLEGSLDIPVGSEGIVLFAHGSGSSRHSPRNQFVAQTLRDGGLATLLFDLLTSEEEGIDVRTRQLRLWVRLSKQREFNMDGGAPR